MHGISTMAAAVLAGAVLVAPPASAQSAAGRVVHLVTGDPGGGTDFAARLMAPGMAAQLGTQVIVENRGGASGIIAAQTVARAAPDGQTLLFYGNPVWLLQYLRDDEVRDKLLATGVEPVGSTTREFIELIKSERSRLGKVIRDAGIRDDAA